MVRAVVWCVILATGCTSARAPVARRVGKVMALGGVAGMVAGAAASTYGDTAPIVSGFALVSAIGIMTFATGELSDPSRPHQETETQRHRRWARILTERAGGAARLGRCARVRRLEKRVHHYDPEVHDFVFMRDPEIVRCLGTPVTDPTPLAPDAAPEAPAAGWEPIPGVSPVPLEPPPTPPPAPPPTLPPPPSP